MHTHLPQNYPFTAFTTRFTTHFGIFALCRLKLSLSSNDLRSWLQRQGSNLRKSSKTKEKSKGDAQRDTQRLVPLGRDLSRVVAAWSKLPCPLKAAILAIVGSVISSPEVER